MGPPDPILGLTEAFQKDPDPTKVGLQVGAYRGDDGKPLVLDAVREAEKRVYDNALNHEYAGIAGVPEFNQLSLKFAYGDDSAPLAEGRIAVVQTLSGTGACRIVGEFVNRFFPGTAMYLPDPTWGNHIPIMKDAGLEVRRYRYLDPATNGLDCDGLLADLAAAPDGSAVLLHACAHNPTGVDPTPEQWAAISAAVKAKGHLAFFDCAYQGFASGDPVRDAAAIRQFVADGHQIMLSQSYAKNFGLYGERIGALSVVCADAEEKARVESQLKILVRPMYSNPPVYGARLVATVLADDALHAQWAGECKDMADRIIAMRSALRERLEALGSSRSWEHITNQIGMFCFTGLSAEQVATLRSEHHVYCTTDGRISMAGVTTGNVDYLAQSIFKVSG